jgi:hypothetical protein
MEHDVMDGFSSEYLAADKSGNTAANRAARERMTAAWSDKPKRLAMAHGKRALSKLSEWSQSNYGVSFSAVRIARELTADEISPEAKRVIAAIENNEPFKAPEA